MPIAAGTAALIAAGASAAGTGLQAYASGKLNKKTLAFNRETRDLQRSWALTDREWENFYNSPAQQVRRLREAGLNPHLMYSNGAAAPESAHAEISNAPDWNPKAPNVGAILSDPVNAYLETRSFQAQQKLLAAQTLKTLTEVDSKSFDLAQRQRLADTQATIMQEIATGKQISNRLNANRDRREEDENLRRSLMNVSNLNEAVQRIKKSISDVQLQDIMRAKGVEDIKSMKQARIKVAEEIDNLMKDGKIKDYEISLNKSGLTKGSATWFQLGKWIIDQLSKSGSGAPSAPRRSPHQRIIEKYFKH